MLNFKPFYVHRNRGTGKIRHNEYRGFTAFIRPAEKDKHVLVSVTFCAPHDNFCRRIGREACEYEYAHEVHARDIPDMLNLAEYHLYNHDKYYYTDGDNHDFAWVWKYLF